ncbi:hypothetical protein [Streptomyces sp. NPDC004533]|uniref:hypothetical protein n=1 Tax=unclassified Streptomyces TaxID=2593676 RepID=UPI0033B26EEE
MVPDASQYRVTEVTRAMVRDLGERAPPRLALRHRVAFVKGSYEVAAERPIDDRRVIPTINV